MNWQHLFEEPDICLHEAATAIAQQGPENTPINELLSFSIARALQDIAYELKIAREEGLPIRSHADE